MTKVTNRYDNKNLIDLAKQQYVEKKTSTIPSELVQLPSQGKIYPKDHPLREGIIEIRHMTAYDEDILTNLSYIQQGVVLDKLIDSLIISSNITSADLAENDKEAILISARILAYGSDYPVTVQDPKTGSEIKDTIDLAKITYKNLEINTDENGESSFKCKDNTNIKFSYSPPKLKIESTNTNLASSFLLNIIRQVNDTRNTEDIKEFIKYKFSLSDSKLFQKYVRSHIPGVLKEYEFKGEDGGTFTAGFQLGSELLWPESD